MTLHKLRFVAFLSGSKVSLTPSAQRLGVTQQHGALLLIMPTGPTMLLDSGDTVGPRVMGPLFNLGA